MKKQSVVKENAFSIFNMLLTAFVTALVAGSFFINSQKDVMYIMYFVIVVILFITIRMTRKYFIKHKETYEYMDITGKYNLITAVMFVIAYAVMKINIIVSVDLSFYVSALIILASFYFSLSFLKIFMFGLGSVMKK